MTHQNEDIDIILEELERADVAADDRALDSSVREDILRGFLQRCATPIAVFLEELKDLRHQSSAGGSRTINTHRVIVEGFSDESATKALNAAIEKVGHYFSESHDVSTTLLQLQELPEGGHRARMEVHLTPFTLRPSPEVPPNELTDKHLRETDFIKQQHFETYHKQNLVFDHFARSNGAISASRVPDFMTINVNDANLMNYMLEKQFFKAGVNAYNSPAPKGFAVILTPQLHVPQSPLAPAPHPDDD